MRRAILILSVTIAAVVVTAVGGAQTPTEVPFPAPKVVQYFVSAQTVTAPGSAQGAGVVTNYFAQGSTVVFQAFAGATATGQIFTADDAKYFYVKIPRQPNVKLTYAPSTSKGRAGSLPWTASWTIPADYPTGIVAVEVQLKSKSGGYGSFVQIPVATAQLTVTKKA